MMMKLEEIGRRKCMSGDEQRTKMEEESGTRRMQQM